MASIALVQDKTVLITSSNSSGLQGFINHIPQEIRWLCVDISRIEECGELCRTLEVMQHKLSDLKKKQSITEKEVHRLQKDIKAKKTVLEEAEASL